MPVLKKTPNQAGPYPPQPWNQSLEKWIYSFPKEDALGIWISNVCLNPYQKSVLKLEQEILESVSGTTLQLFLPKIPVSIFTGFMFAMETICEVQDVI